MLQMLAMQIGVESGQQQRIASIRLFDAYVTNKIPFMTYSFYVDLDRPKRQEEDAQKTGGGTFSSMTSGRLDARAINLGDRKGESRGRL